jgi:hypothetical protein
MITLVVQEYLTQSNLILQNISNKNIDIFFFEIDMEKDLV